VFDADVHLHEAPADLAPFCEEPWRRALAADKGEDRWLDTPGYSPLTQLDPMLGDYPEPDVHMVRTADQMRADLDRRGVDAALLITDRFIGLAEAQDVAYATAIAAAYNRYLRERWLDPTRGLYGALLVPGQDPARAAAEIEVYAGVDGFKAVLLSTVHTYPLYGDRSYDRIYAAAQAAGLPVVLHGATTYGTIFPYQLQGFASPLARGGLAQPLGAIANLTSLVTTGVFARFPELKVLFCEAGLAWLPFVSSRLDGQYRHLRQSAPELTMRPSEYIHRNVWTATHPLGDFDDPAALARAVEAIGADRIVYGSDFPHFDQDEPAEAANRLPSPVMAANARSLFRLS
jgi:uncharacterized protein